MRDDLNDIPGPNHALIDDKIEAKVNIAEADRFLKLLDPITTNFEFRSFDDNVDRDSPTLLRVFHGPLVRHATELKRLNRKGAGIFVTVNATDRKGRARENIIRVRAVFADLDGTPLTPVMAERLQPHIVVESSPGQFHVYWLVDGLALPDFTAVEKAIIRRFDSIGIHDLPRVMRLPGFLHAKVKNGVGGQPFVSRIIHHHHGPAYPAASFERAELETHTPGQQQEVTLLDMWKAASALEVIPNHDLDWRQWNKIGMAVWIATGGSPYGLDAFETFSAKSSKYHPARTRRIWKGYHRSPPNQLGLGTLIFLANQADPEWRERMMAEVTAVMGGERHG